MRYPNVQTVQIIFNMFRTKPAERVFPEANRRQVGSSRVCRSQAAC